MVATQDLRRKSRLMRLCDCSPASVNGRACGGSLFTEHRYDNFVARQHDLLDSVPTHGAIQRSNDFLSMMQMVVLNVPAVPRLRPASD